MVLGKKMVGIKGKSGRKKRDDGKKMRAVALYIPMYEYDTRHMNDPKGAKYQWIPEAWFRQYKRVFGARWQDKLRGLMQSHLKDYRQRHMWDCECDNLLDRWHRKTERECFKCGFTPNELQRLKTANAVRMHARNDTSTRIISKCNCGEPLTLEMTKYGKTYKCMKCNPTKVGE